MKLSQQDIRIIEDVLAEVANGKSCRQIAESRGLRGTTCTGQLTSMLIALEKLGVSVPARVGRSINMAELKEFRAWKAGQKVGVAPHHAD